ncbi:uncharacterized protein Z519_12727 [Cladophialophora bantiana CBS 173.52]|uniref:Uncharacterized protein n=1 Tax=Cladophialophora bantiana (strain ATCC 10958 / CBS 173.52 / CDC B-1940 / NIH 8579) TaxID=1442370 RepID=A0A0D2FIZ3_CLAB1|nr:uncharacterized protein Z519_12727 [Cladophialophora bantiana CBS 173.52]KIW86672.1 hypothetical protein Z519_12727 [Cladophialophora bantiana CBS 173.52]
MDSISRLYITDIKLRNILSRGDHPSVLFSDIPTVDSLLRQVDQLQEAVDGDILERLEEENALLEQCIKCGRQKLVSLASILREAFESYVVLNAYLENLQKEERAISEEWASLLQCDTVETAGAEERIRKSI